MTENRENWLYPDASGLYFPHDGFIMRASDGKQYDYEEECELLNMYDKKYNEYRNDVLRLEKENEQLKSDNKDFAKRYRELFNKYIKLQKENKELKQSDKDAWNLIRYIYNEIKEDGYMDWGRIQDLVEFEE